MNLNHENSISENFLGEEQNFPGFGPSALILGNFVPHLENFRKYYIFVSGLQMQLCIERTSRYERCSNCQWFRYVSEAYLQYTYERSMQHYITYRYTRVLNTRSVLTDYHNKCTNLISFQPREEDATYLTWVRA